MIGDFLKIFPHGLDQGVGIARFLTVFLGLADGCLPVSIRQLLRFHYDFVCNLLILHRKMEINPFLGFVNKKMYAV